MHAKKAINQYKGDMNRYKYVVDRNSAETDEKLWYINTDLIIHKIKI